MSLTDNGERQHRKDKRKRDRFSVTIIGVVIYSIVLIAVMVSSYIGVKAIFRNYDKKIAEAGNTEPVQEVDEEPTPTPEPTAEPVEDEEIEHDVPADELTDAETGVVDYSVIRFKPGTRNKSLKWKDSVFSKIENVKDPANALVNTYDYKRVSVKLPDNDSSEYKVYSDPQSGAVEKITEIEDCGDNLSVIDYYYDNGNINYVSEYKTYIDKPVNISSADIESRYYFRNDTLVRYIYCKDGNATEYNVANIDSYSKGTVDQYDYLEQEM